MIAFFYETCDWLVFRRVIRDTVGITFIGQIAAKRKFS